MELQVTHSLDEVLQGDCQIRIIIYEDAIEHDMQVSSLGRIEPALRMVGQIHHLLKDVHWSPPALHIELQDLIINSYLHVLIVLG